MKYVCINNMVLRGDNELVESDVLTIGKTYEINFLENKIMIVVDDGSERRITTHEAVNEMFKPLSEVREEKINKILYMI